MNNFEYLTPGLRVGRQPGNPPTVRILNFKSIESVAVHPKGITVVVGANSSGKSSLLQALLFLTQSISSRSVVSNGELVRLGTPLDVIRDKQEFVGFEFETNMKTGAEGDDVNIRYRVSLTEEKNELVPTKVQLFRDDKELFCASGVERISEQAKGSGSSGVRTLRVDESDSPLDFPPDSYLFLQGMVPVQLGCKADRRLFEGVINELVSRSLTGNDLEFLRTLLEGEEFHAESALWEVQEEMEDDVLDGILAQRLTDKDRDELTNLYFESATNDGWILVPFRPFRFFNRTPRFVDGPGSPDDVPAFRAIAPIVSSAAQSIESFAESVSYLGPLREDPRFAYPLGHTVPGLPVGEKGEFTAAYYQRNEHRTVRYIDPLKRPRNASLQRAVDLWCSHLEIASGISVQQEGKLGHKLMFTVGSSQRDPTAIGVGASQLLPVVVSVLGAESGSLLMFEQPELHLHPRVQSLLGDFFAYARNDVRFLIETHSEYLITRLRLRVADGTLNPDRIAVKFVQQEKDPETEDLFSDFYTLSLDEFGDFDHWPTGFFDTLDKDSIAITQHVANAVLSKDPTEPA